ncbi:hypothetical protein [Glaciecola sp. SC05]|uniref:hypothetical protein n=1 Tax=Glaciecola sp. SC05 TaxID=1987355 RepID=UPI0035276695
MKPLIFFYKNPLTWIVVLLLLQVWVAVVLTPNSEQSHAQNNFYDEVLMLADGNVELTEFIESQNLRLKKQEDVIVALTDMQKYLGGLAAIFIFLFLLLQYIKERKNQQ